MWYYNMYEVWKNSNVAKYSNTDNYICIKFDKSLEVKYPIIISINWLFRDPHQWKQIILCISAIKGYFC